MHHGARDGEPLHQAAGEFAHHLAGAVGELEFLQLLIGAAGALAGALAEVGAVKQQHLAGRQRKIQIGPLRHHANHALGLHLLLPDVELADENAAAGWLGAGGQDADRSGFARAVRPQQTKDLASGNLERDAIERKDFDLLFLLLPPTGRTGRTEGKTTAAGHGGRRRIINLAQILDANPNSHGLRFLLLAGIHLIHFVAGAAQDLPDASARLDPASGANSVTPSSSSRFRTIYQTAY